ncbi:MAG: response regulator transcription factor [Flavobacteriaceae bacterium]|nr:response regulator transcription factor [Flavobacteriaceae bacterium]
MDTKNIFIVDDHVLFARSLAGLVNTFPHYQVVETFNNGAELVDALSTGIAEPSLILLDIKMPIMDGLATMKWLKKYHPFVKVLALSMEDDEQTILAMLRSGAKGYLLKDTQPDLLNLAMDSVIQQGYFHTELVTHVLMHSLHEKHTPEQEYALKENEITFIKLACEEKTYKEIAEEMSLSPKTIDGYRQQLFDKLKIKNRTGLVIFALKNKIIEI